MDTLQLILEDPPATAHDAGWRPHGGDPHKYRLGEPKWGPNRRRRRIRSQVNTELENIRWWDEVKVVDERERRRWDEGEEPIVFVGLIVEPGCPGPWDDDPRWPEESEGQDLERTWRPDSWSVYGYRDATQYDRRYDWEAEEEACYIREAFAYIERHDEYVVKLLEWQRGAGELHDQPPHPWPRQEARYLPAVLRHLQRDLSPLSCCSAFDIGLQ